MSDSRASELSLHCRDNPDATGCKLPLEAGVLRICPDLLALVLLPVAVALYDLKPVMGFLPLAGCLALGVMAVSAPGTLHAAIAVQARAKDVLLPLLLFPVLVPGLLASVKSTTLIMG